MFKTAQSMQPFRRPYLQTTFKQSSNKVQTKFKQSHKFVEGLTAYKMFISSELLTSSVKEFKSKNLSLAEDSAKPQTTSQEESTGSGRTSSDSASTHLFGSDQASGLRKVR